MEHWRNLTKEDVVEKILHDDKTQDARNENGLIGGQEMLEIWKAHERNKPQKTPGSTTANV